MKLVYARYYSEGEMEVDSIKEAIEIGDAMIAHNTARPLKVVSDDGGALFSFWFCFFVGKKSEPEPKQPIPDDMLKLIREGRSGIAKG